MQRVIVPKSQQADGSGLELSFRAQKVQKPGHAALRRQVVRGLPGKPRRSASAQREICAGVNQHLGDLPMTCYEGEHQRAQSMLGGDVEVGAVSNEQLDEPTMAGMRGQHQRGLSMTVQRVDRSALHDQILHVDGIPASDCVLPCRIHAGRPADRVSASDCFAPSALAIAIDRPSPIVDNAAVTVQVHSQPPT